MRLFFVFLFCGSFQLVFAQQLRIVDQPLATVLTQLENDYGHLFSYREADIQGITITANLPTDDVKALLNALFEPTDLQYKIVANNYIIISQKKATKDVSSTIELPLLAGQIRDSLTGQPLSYANVFIKNSSVGTFTDLQGRFQLRYDFSEEDSLVVSYVGYAEQRFKASAFSTSSYPTIALHYVDFADNFIVVTDYLTDGIQLRNNNAYNSLQPAKIGSLPGQAEPDVLQTIRFLPGISSPDGTAAGMNIRGGAADQNLLLWEDIPIYHAAHYFGMISAFNPYIIDEARVYRGGFAANYGGRISGVIDLKSNGYSLTKNQFGAGVNFLNAYTYGKLKSTDQKLTLRYSLRHSINDLWQSPTYHNITHRIQQSVLFDIPISNRLPPEIRASSDFRFFDGHLTANYQLNDRSSISAAALWGTNYFYSTIANDAAKSRQIDSLNLQNNGLRLRWQQQWQPHFSSEVLAVNSDYSYDYEYRFADQGRDQDNRRGIKNNRIGEQQLQFNNTYFTPQQQQIRAGYQLHHYAVESQIARLSRNDAPTDQAQNNSFFLHSFYTDFSTKSTNKWGIEAGLRWNYIDRNASRNNPQKSSFLAPRLRLWYQPLEHLQLYGNAGKYFQFLNQIIEIEGDEASIEMPIWVLGGAKEFPFLSSTQYQVGAVWQRKTLLIDVQLYHKNIDGLTSLASNFAENLSSRFHLGAARIQGVDVLIKKRWGQFRSWWSYSYSNIEHRFPTFFDAVFPATTEQPHQLHWVNTYQINNFNFSLGWKLAAGTPYSDRRNFRLTRRMGSDEQDNFNQLQPINNQFNSERLPWQHQLDVSVNYTYQTKGWKAVVGLSLLNVYNQQNIYNRSFFISQKISNQQQMNRLELRYLDRANLGFTPNAVVRLEW